MSARSILNSDVTHVDSKLAFKTRHILQLSYSKVGPTLPCESSTSYKIASYLLLRPSANTGRAQRSQASVLTLSSNRSAKAWGISSGRRADTYIDEEKDAQLDGEHLSANHWRKVVHKCNLWEATYNLPERYSDAPKQKSDTLKKGRKKTGNPGDHRKCCAPGSLPSNNWV